MSSHLALANTVKAELQIKLDTNKKLLAEPKAKFGSKLWEQKETRTNFKQMESFKVSYSVVPPPTSIGVYTLNLNNGANKKSFRLVELETRHVGESLKCPDEMVQNQTTIDPSKTSAVVNLKVSCTVKQTTALNNPA